MSFIKSDFTKRQDDIILLLTDRQFSSLVKIIPPLRVEKLISQVPFVVNNLLFYKCVCIPVWACMQSHTHTHTHTDTHTHRETHTQRDTHTHTHTRELHFQEITLSLKQMVLFPISFATHVERFLRQKRASGCVGLELGERMVTKPSAHEATGGATATGKTLSSAESEKTPRKRTPGNNNR